MVIQNSPRFSVKEIMNSNVVSVGPDASLKHVSELMSSKKIGSVVIVDKNALVGIITERDFATKVVLENHSGQTKVSEVMSSPVTYLSSDKSVADVIDLMANKEIRKIPVVDSGRVIGIVTGTEFLRLFIQSNDEDLQKIYQQYLKRVYNNWFVD